MAHNQNIPFIVIVTNYDEGQLTGGVYDYALLRLRNALQVDYVQSGRHSCPVLIEYTSETNPRGWFDINFQSDSTTRVRTRFRTDDLYLCGYQVNNQRWREFKRNDGRHLVDPNSRYLSFDGSYTALARAGGALTQRTLGREALIGAVDALAASANDEQIARGLIVIIMMFSEAARFRPIQSFVQTVFFPVEEPPRYISDWMIDLVHRWENLSGFILSTIRDGTEWVPQRLEILGPGPGYQPITVVVSTVGEMLDYMGILQNSCDNASCP